MGHILGATWPDFSNMGSYFRARLKLAAGRCSRQRWGFGGRWGWWGHGWCCWWSCSARGNCSEAEVRATLISHLLLPWREAFQHSCPPGSVSHAQLHGSFYTGGSSTIIRHQRQGDISQISAILFSPWYHLFKCRLWYCVTKASLEPHKCISIQPGFSCCPRLTGNCSVLQVIINDYLVSGGLWGIQVHLCEGHLAQNPWHITEIVQPPLQAHFLPGEPPETRVNGSLPEECLRSVSQHFRILEERRASSQETNFSPLLHV